MPEETGIEPQELFEQTEKSHHIHHEHGTGESEDQRRFAMRSAVTASILAVGAALGSLLSGHAANEAILKTVQASDQWSYYQAKSTKEQIYKADESLLKSLGTKNAAAIDIDNQANKYAKEKDEVQSKASQLQDEGRADFERHQKLSLAVAAFQIGIVLSSVAILTRSSWLYYESLFAGLFGVVFCIVGMLPK